MPLQTLSDDYEHVTVRTTEVREGGCLDSAVVLNPEDVVVAAIYQILHTKGFVLLLIHMQ